MLSFVVVRLPLDTSNIPSEPVVISFFIQLLPHDVKKGKVGYVFVDYNFFCIVDVGYFNVNGEYSMSFMCVVLREAKFHLF